MKTSEYKCPECGVKILPQSEYCPVCGKKLNSYEAYKNTAFGRIYKFEEKEIPKWLYNDVYKKFYGAVKNFKSWLSLSSPVKFIEKIIKKLLGKFEGNLKNKADAKAKNRDHVPNKLEQFIGNKQVIHIFVKVLCFLLLWSLNASMLKKSVVTYKAEPRILDNDNYTVKKKLFSNEYEITTNDSEISLKLSLPKYYSTITVSSNNESKQYTSEEDATVNVNHGFEYTVDIVYDDNSTGTIEFTIK